jgi:hypothetical protein
MSKYETFAGQVTMGETYSKILHLLGELEDQYSVMAHLHNLQDTPKDNLHARGWLNMAQLTQVWRQQVTNLAQGQLRPN